MAHRVPLVLLGLTLLAIAVPAVAAPSVDGLLRDLADADPAARSKACVALRDLWPDAAAAVPALMDAATDDDAGVAKEAKATLERFGAKGLEAHVNFLRHGGDAERDFYVRMLDATAPLGTARPSDYCVVIADPGMDTAARHAATFVLGLVPGERDDADVALGLLVDLMGIRHAGIREAAASSLAIRSGYAPPGPRDLLRGQPDAVRFAAMRLLGEIEDGETVETLVGILGEESRLLRSAACEALANAGNRAVVAESVLEKLAGRRDLDADLAGRALARLGFTRSLLARLEAGDSDQKLRAALALSWAGPDGKAAVPVLSESFLRSPAQLHPVATHAEVAEALARIGPAAAGAVPSLEAGLAYGDDPSIPVAAAAALCRIVAPSAEVLAVLQNAFRPPPGRKIRVLDARVAIRAVILLGPAAKPLVTPLCKVLMIRPSATRPDWPAPGEFAKEWLVRTKSLGRLRRMKRLALDALASMGPDASAARKVLAWILAEHDDPVIRYRAARALRRIGD